MSKKRIKLLPAAHCRIFHPDWTDLSKIRIVALVDQVNRLRKDISIGPDDLVHMETVAQLCKDFEIEAVTIDVSRLDSWPKSWQVKRLYLRSTRCFPEMFTCHLEELDMRSATNMPERFDHCSSLVEATILLPIEIRKLPQVPAHTKMTFYMMYLPIELPWFKWTGTCTVFSERSAILRPQNLQPVTNLCDAILLGLAETNATTWSDFIKRGLYDPRLFLVVGSFIFTDIASFLSH